MTTSPRILIVEDEEPLSLLLRYNLEAEGYEVQSADRGDDATKVESETLARGTDAGGEQRGQIERQPAVERRRDQPEHPGEQHERGPVGRLPALVDVPLLVERHHRHQ